MQDFTTLTCSKVVTRNRIAGISTANGQPTSWSRSVTGPVNALGFGGGLLRVGGAFLGINGQAAGGYGSVSLSLPIVPLDPCGGLVAG